MANEPVENGAVLAADSNVQDSNIQDSSIQDSIIQDNNIQAEADSLEEKVYFHCTWRGLEVHIIVTIARNPIKFLMLLDSTLSRVLLVLGMTEVK